MMRSEVNSMGHWWSAGVLTLGVATASAWAAPVSERGKVIAEFARGAGPTEIGVTDAGPEALPAGPSGLVHATGGGVLILDSVNKRILRVSAGGTVEVASSPVGAGLAQDIVRSGRAVYVLNSQPAYIGVDRGKGSIGGDNTTEASGGPRHALGLFESNGAVLNALPAGVPEGAGRTKAGVGKWLKAPGVRGAVDQYRVIRTDGRVTQLELRAIGAPGKPRVLALPMDTGRFGSVALMGSDDSGRAYIRIEQFSESAGVSVAKVWVVRYSKQGQMEGGYDVPDDAMELVPNRYLAITPDGLVYFLESRRDKTRLLAMNFIPANEFSAHYNDKMASLHVGASAGTVAAAPRLDPTVEAATPSIKITRSEILRLAETYRSAQWTLGSKNYRGDLVSSCANGGLWRRPAHLDGMLSKQVVGVPYNWGGFMTVVEFQKRIAQDSVAGNICTCTACIDPKVAGVDCSGYVSQIWKIKRYTTAKLNGAVKRLKSFDDLRPGDAMNKAGSHVRLFVSQSPNGNGMIRAYESSVSCGGVCLRDFSAKQLAGYVPLAAPSSD